MKIQTTLEDFNPKHFHEYIIPVNNSIEIFKEKVRRFYYFLVLSNYKCSRCTGKLIMVDIDYPRNRNWLGMQATKAWIAMGDIIRDMGKIFEQCNFKYEEKEIGGFGSVHLFIAEKC